MAAHVQLADHKALDNEKLKAVFSQGFPKYSLQWKSSEGFIAACVNIQKNVS